MNTLLARHTRRAAHALHRCNGCGGLIAYRDHYSDSRCAGDGHVWTWREHALCAALADYWCDEPDGWGWDVRQELMAEWWHEFVATFAPGGDQ